MLKVSPNNRLSIFIKTLPKNFDGILVSFGILVLYSVVDFLSHGNVILS